MPSSVASLPFLPHFLACPQRPTVRRRIPPVLRVRLSQPQSPGSSQSSLKIRTLRPSAQLANLRLLNYKLPNLLEMILSQFPSLAYSGPCPVPFIYVSHTAPPRFSTPTELTFNVLTLIAAVAAGSSQVCSSVFFPFSVSYVINATFRPIDDFGSLL
jgi:hypothetical protein